ncbi:MAG TPA: hypothetical protein VFY21_02935 [Xanthobacteraceae bacterium]|nr:hypothetical protein [Xanthobacteraceae bacterium]
MRIVSHLAAVALFTLPAAAADSVIPAAQNDAWNKPPLELSEEQKAAVTKAVGAENSYQATPEGFEARVGAAISKEIAPHALPRPLIYEVEALRNYKYSKLDRNVLIIDPMSNRIVAVIPRITPAIGEKVKPEEWAATRGREMLGLPPIPVKSGEGADRSDAASGPVHERRGIQQVGSDKTEREEVSKQKPDGENAQKSDDGENVQEPR